MAKVPSPFLTGATGKFAGAAFQQSPGNGTILREVVKPTNPSTEAQVEQRAKFKLMSQVATAFKSVIAMKREGNITPRNMFVKINSPLLTYSKEEKQASIYLYDLQLTKSSEQVSISSETGEGGTNVTLSSQLPILYGAVFVLVGQNPDNDAIVIKKIERKTQAEPSQSISHIFDNVSAGNDIVLAYGITQKTDGLSVIYGDFTKSESSAVLDVFQKLAENSALTKTKGIDL